MSNLTPAQDKAIRAMVDGVFPKGTRDATIKAIESAGFIFSFENDGVWDLTAPGREYLGLPPIANTTTDEILAELDTNPWDLASQFADHGDVGLSPEKIEEIFSPLDIVLPAGWDMRKRNRTAWEGLSQEEIEKDIMTRVPANRADKRYAKRHQNHNH